jgi:hypothetical protein
VVDFHIIRKSCFSCYFAGLCNTRAWTWLCVIRAQDRIFNTAQTLGVAQALLLAQSKGNTHAQL